MKVDGTWKMNGPDTILVGKSSATHGRPWEIGNRFVWPIDTDHSGPVKFISRHDENYLTVLSVLRDHVGDEQSRPEYRLREAEARQSGMGRKKQK